MFSNRSQSINNTTAAATSTATSTLYEWNNRSNLSQASVLDDSAIISKYSPSPSLSENANNLIQRKRDLILNSKKVVNFCLFINLWTRCLSVYYLVL